MVGRQELSLSAYDRFLDARLDEVAQVLGSLTRLAEASGEGWLPGTILPFSGAVLEGLPFDTLYSADISYLSSESRLVSTTTPLTHIAWLVPVFASEAGFIARHGHEAFEASLSRRESDVDLLDFEREAVVQD